MEISDGSILKAAEVPIKAQVQLQKSATKQVEAVAQEILKSIEAVPEPGKGAKVNTVA